MQPFRRERHNKPHKCRSCPKSFKSSNGLKYHLDKVHIDEKIKMETECAEEKPRGMQNKPRSIPPALDLSPEVNLLKEFAVIATSPQSPLVQEVSGESMDVRCSDGDIPHPQDFQPREWPCVSQYIPDSPTQTLLQALSAAKWRCFLATTRINFPDEDGWAWKTVDDIGVEGISEDLFQHGLRVVDIERISRRHDENSDEFIVSFQSCNNEQTSLQAEITADHPFYVKGKDAEFWASLSPCSSEVHHGISCQPLECGDVCMLPYGRDVVGYLSGTQWDADKTSSEFTAMSTAALTLSCMAKDKQEHRHRRSKLLSESRCPGSMMKRSSMQQFSKRPMNAFMLFAKRFRVEITQAHPGKDNRAISVILGDKWKAMNQEDRKEYVIQAKLLADEHKRVNPDCWKRKRSSEGSSKISYRRP